MRAPPPGYTGMTRYRVDLMAEEGLYVDWIAGKFEGPMHQVWLEASGQTFPTPTFADSWPPGAPEWADSHVMVYPAWPFSLTEVPGWEVTEDNPSPDANMEGVGTYIGGPDGGDFCLGATYFRTTKTCIAQIVVPDGEVVIFTGQGMPTCEPGCIIEYYVDEFYLVIPEPATLALLAVGAVGAVIRRRR